MTGCGIYEWPPRITGYRTYIREYERLREEYLSELQSGNEERAALLAYEAVCVHSQMRRIERLIEERSSTKEGYKENHAEAEPTIELRKFLFFRYIRGLSMEEAAEQMDISRSTVYRIAAQVEKIFERII